MKLPFLIFIIHISFNAILATDYHVGPGQAYININDVPWESLNAGDNVFIHWRSTIDGGPYQEKWVVNVQGTSSMPFTITGVSGPGGELPVIDGNGASTRQQLNYWNEERSIIKVGGSSIPADGLPSYIVIENLEIRSGYKNYSFTDDGGNTQMYIDNAASIHVEKVNNLIIRNCTLHDSGNGIFVSFNSNDVLIQGNYIYGNGNISSAFEHNTYTEATNITYEYNRFGTLRSGANGNNLKDRSAGLVVRYNWIQGGNRLLDLVDSGTASIINNPDYGSTFVYGNILIEEDGGNSQVIHYGGDSGTTANYRKGVLYFYNNTLYSIRAGNTTLARLSTNNETADIRNNILHATASGNKLAFLDASGQISIYNNLMKPMWVNSHQGGGFSGSVTNDGSTLEVLDPGFNDGPAYDFTLASGSPAIDAGTSLSGAVLPSHNVVEEYSLHQSGVPRVADGFMDIGGYESNTSLAVSQWQPLHAKIENNKVVVSWGTSSEVNSSHFDLLRSDNLMNWEKLTSVAAKGSPQANSFYEVVDPSPFSGKSFYKLMEIGEDGRETQFGLVSIFSDPNSFLKIFPNPTADYISIEGLNSNALVRVQVFDISGRLIMQKQVISDEFRLDVTSLKSGLFYVQIDENNRILKLQFVKH